MPLAPEDPSTFTALVCAALSASIGALGIRLWRRVSSTTLAAPAVWVVIVATFCAAVEATLAWRGDSANSLGASMARYAAAVGTCCPLMAVLGAKRPQDRGWQWIVLSLWVILIVPAGQTWAAHTGSHIELAPMWRIMLVALVALGLLNYLPTRHGVSAVLVAIGQFELMRPYLMGTPATENARHRIAALVALTLAAVMASVAGRKKKGTGPFSIVETEKVPGTLSRFTHRWLAFRNAWGAFWALRILQRANETAELSNWPIRLQWHGFVPTSNAAPPEIDERTAAHDERTAAHIDQTLNSLLRRFERINKDISQ